MAVPDTHTLTEALTHTLKVVQVAAELRDKYGVITSVDTARTGTAVEACTWCYLDQPEPAVVWCNAAEPEACLGCVGNLLEAATTSGVHLDDIRVDIRDIPSPRILNYPVAEPVQRGRVTVIDNDARAITVETVGVETYLRVVGHYGSVARLDLSTDLGKAAARTLADALTAALKAA